MAVDPKRLHISKWEGNAPVEHAKPKPTTAVYNFKKDTDDYHFNVKNKPKMAICVLKKKPTTAICFLREVREPIGRLHKKHGVAQLPPHAA